MELRESVPSLNLESIVSDRRANGNRAEKRESNRSEDSKNEMETQTCGAAAVGGGAGEGGGRKSEIENSKSSFELLDAAKDEESLSSLSTSLSPVFRDAEKDRRLKRHHPDLTDNIESNAFETNESSPLPDSIRSSAREMIPPSEQDKHLQICRNRSRRRTDKSDRDLECSLESAVEEAVVAENRRLREVLLRERRHRLKEKNRIRQVLIAIDEALSTLPTRLGKIRIQNQKNLMRMNTLPVEFHDRGDFEMIVGNCPKYFENVQEAKRASVQLSEDVYSDMSNPRSSSLFKKIESLNNLIEGMKNGCAAPIEAVLDNELCAISLLKNEIKYTKRKIEQKNKTDSGSVVADWQSENRQILYPKNWNPRRTIDSEEMEKLEKYIWLQKEAIAMLSLQVGKTRDLCAKEMKQKEQAQSEKKALMSEIMKLKNKEESQRSGTRSSERTSAPRPFRIIKELKCQLEEKDKTLSNLKAKISRLEAAAANKGTLLDNEKKKNDELEGRLKILAKENKSFSMQINSLQYINKELKEQMDVLKSQIDILMEKNADLTASSPYDLKKNFTEIMEMLKKEDARARAVQEEADRKLKELQNQHLKEIEMIKMSFERCEKMNLEYLRTLKGVILYLHKYQSEKHMKRKSRNSYGKVKEILGITEQELESLFGGNLKSTSEKELQDLYDQCYSFINGGDDHEFSFKLSAWLFDLIKQKIVHQNFNESLSE